MVENGAWINILRVQYNINMERKKLIWLRLFVGSTVGGFIPSLWGSDLISMSGVIGSAIGGIIGIWLGFRLGE